MPFTYQEALEFKYGEVYFTVAASINLNGNTRDIYFLEDSDNNWDKLPSGFYIRYIPSPKGVGFHVYAVEKTTNALKVHENHVSLENHWDKKFLDKLIVLDKQKKIIRHTKIEFRDGIEMIEILAKKYIKDECNHLFKKNISSTQQIKQRVLTSGIEKERHPEKTMKVKDISLGYKYLIYPELTSKYNDLLFEYKPINRNINLRNQFSDKAGKDKVWLSFHPKSSFNYLPTFSDADQWAKERFPDEYKTGTDNIEYFICCCSAHEWKFHLYIKPEQLGKACELIFPLLEEYNVPEFKILRPAVCEVLLNNEKDKVKKSSLQRFADGCNVTIYCIPNKHEKPKQTWIRYAKLLRMIEYKLKINNINTTKHYLGERSLGKYTTIRHPGQSKYHAGIDTDNYNPERINDPFAKIMHQDFFIQSMKLLKFIDETIIEVNQKSQTLLLFKSIKKTVSSYLDSFLLDRRSEHFNGYLNLRVKILEFYLDEFKKIERTHWGLFKSPASMIIDELKCFKIVFSDMLKTEIKPQSV